jgi:drug/metabolite transporter (DMT)-like permease
MQQSIPSDVRRATDQGWLLISLMLLVDSVHFIFARLLLPYISPDVSAMYVQGVGTLLFGLYAVATGQLNWAILRRHFWFFLAIGALIGISTNMSYTAIAFIDPGTASMLGKVSTIFSLAFGVFWLHEHFTLRQWVGSAVAILGSVAIAFQPGGDLLRFGSLLILGGTLLYALHTALVKRYSGQIDFINFFFFRVFATTAVLFFVAAGRGVLVWPQADAWRIVILTAVVDIIISRVLFYVALRRLNMSIHTILLTLSPVATILWSWLLFAALPGPQQLIGGAAVLAGVMLVTWPRR